MIPLGNNLEAIMSHPTPVALRPHHEYQSWTTTWYDDMRTRRTKRFGKQGVVSRSQAQALYRNWLKNEFEAKPFIRNPDDPTVVTARQLAEWYKRDARTIFVKNGELTTHIWQVDAAMDAMADAFGESPADRIDFPGLANLLDAMQYGAGGKVLAVKTVNGRLWCIKAAAKWARGKKIITKETLVDILAVPALRAGRCTAKASKVIDPVAEDVVEDTKRHLPPTVVAMVDVEWLTGMRPGEVCNMRACDIDRSGDVWVYTPFTHKLEHKNKQRRIALGPAAQGILRPFIDAVRKPTAYLFSPATAQQERRDERTRNRKTPASCGNTVGSVHTNRPERAPGDHYTSQSYRKAIRHACRAEQKARRAKNPKASFEVWHPNQLRHSWATRMREQFGIEAASDGLGHNVPATTAIYAERSLSRAKEIAKVAG